MAVQFDHTNQADGAVLVNRSDFEGEAEAQSIAARPLKALYIPGLDTSSFQHDLEFSTLNHYNVCGVATANLKAASTSANPFSGSAAQA